MASRNLGTTAWSFTGPMPEKMQSPTRMAANSDASTSLQSLNRKIEKISGYGSLASVKCHHSSTTGLNPCVTMTERSSMRFRESRRVLYCALFSCAVCFSMLFPHSPDFLRPHLVRHSLAMLQGILGEIYCFYCEVSLLFSQDML